MRKAGVWIREARHAAGLTQEHLGRRLGLKGRAIYRWERDEVAPTARHLRSLIQEIQAVNPRAAAKLNADLASEEAARGASPRIQAPLEPDPPVTVPSPPETLELAVLRMADELDLPARRLRRPLMSFLQRLQATNLSLELAESELGEWIAREQ